MNRVVSRSWLIALAADRIHGMHSAGVIAMLVGAWGGPTALSYGFVHTVDQRLSSVDEMAQIGGACS